MRKTFAYKLLRLHHRWRNLPAWVALAWLMLAPLTLSLTAEEMETALIRRKELQNYQPAGLKQVSLTAESTILAQINIDRQNRSRLAEKQLPEKKPAINSPGTVDAPATIVDDTIIPEQFNAAVIGQELLQKLDEFDAMPKMNAAELELFLQKLLEMTGSSAWLSSVAISSDHAASEYGDDCIGSYHGPEREIWLLQMRQISDRSYQFLRPYTEAQLPSKHLRGVILSLLDSDGDDLTALDNMADWFTRLNLPLVILVDHTTKGNAEKLSAKLQQNGAFLVGEQLPDNLQNPQMITLSTGQKLLLPMPDKNQMNNVEQTRPDLIWKKNGRAIPGNVPKEWLQKAVDFLIVKNALEK